MKNSIQSQAIKHQGLDRAALIDKVKAMYTRVANDANGEFHFEMGREMALRLGYKPAELDAAPVESIESFAGVGYHFDYAGIEPGNSVLDLGSGSAMDVFMAASKTGMSGRVIGVDMTQAQLVKASHLAYTNDYQNVWFVSDEIEKFEYIPHSLDVVISNGVINLISDKRTVFRNIARNLKPNGRLAISDIVSDVQLPESIKCNASLWAACIGGAMQRSSYFDLIEESGLRITDWRINDYHFISNSALGATRKYGVHSISLRAVKV